MGREHTPQTVWRAEGLYIVEGLTYEEVAAATGVSRTQIQRWAVKYNWEERRRQLREELRQARTQMLSDTLALAQAVLKEARESPEDPQKIYAAARLLPLALGALPKPREDVPAYDKAAVFLENLEFVARVLKETDPEGLKVLNRNFDHLVNRFK
ncbi:MAG: hypothetical protein JRI59_06765, partial [Deltaproteobacteria bacterium]|nr:hypothetical protein [Deltaproteobacteria bacterium]